MLRNLYELIKTIWLTVLSDSKAEFMFCFVLQIIATARMMCMRQWIVANSAIDMKKERKKMIYEESFKECSIQLRA